MKTTAHLTVKQAFDAIEDQLACGISPVKELLYTLIGGADEVANSNMWQLMADRLCMTQDAIIAAMQACKDDAPDKQPAWDRIEALERQIEAAKAERHMALGPAHRAALLAGNLGVILNRVSAAWSVVQHLHKDEDIEHEPRGTLFLLEDALESVYDDLEETIKEARELAPPPAAAQ